MQPKKKGNDPASLLGEINPASAACFESLVRRKQGAVWTALWPKFFGGELIAGQSRGRFTADTALIPKAPRSRFRFLTGFEVRLDGRDI